MIGIFMVYGKIFEKMGVSAPELVRERIASAKYTNVNCNKRSFYNILPYLEDLI